MSEHSYRELVEAARADPSVIGLILTGSRGRGVFVTPASDWDVRLVVRDDAYEKCEAEHATPHGSSVEVAVVSLRHFELKAGEVGSPNEWDRYSYVRAQVVLDKLDGRIQALVEEKSVLPKDASRTLAADALDTYINSYYRAEKNLSNGRLVEGHLDAESISPFLTALFAIHERVRPFNKFLRWELETFPLEQWGAAELLPRLETITATGDLGEQQALFRDMERLAREHGLAHVVDGWEPDLAWLRGD